MILQIYKLNSNEKYAEYGGKGDGDQRAVRWFDPLLGDPLPGVDNWSPPSLLQYLGDGKKKRALKTIGDFPGGSANSFIKKEAAERLSSFLDKTADLYPVNLMDDLDNEYFLVHIKNELPFDSLMRNVSIGKPVKYGPKANQGYFSPLEKWVFDDSYLVGQDIFVLPDSAYTIYVSERFKDAVIDAGLKGFVFQQEFWDENPIIT